MLNNYFEFITEKFNVSKKSSSNNIFSSDEYLNMFNNDETVDFRGKFIKNTMMFS